MYSMQHLIQVVLVSSIFAQSACSQTIVTDYAPYQALPTTPLAAVNNSGVFTWPLTGSVELYEVGSLMNISWSSTFSRTNLWLVPNFDWSSSLPLISDTYSKYFEWTVQCLGDCKVPWLVRATDAEGEVQTNGGFVSAEFWIMPVGDNSTNASSDKTSTSTISIKSTVTISPPRMTITINTTSTTAVQTSTPSAQSAATNATSLLTPASTTRAPMTSRAPESAIPSPESTQQSGKAIKGAEIVVGVALAAIIGAAVSWCL